jgi:hypothetical protein
MIATHYAEMAAGVWKLPLFDVLNPGAEDADRNVVLFLACDRARMTPDTTIVINYESVPQLHTPEERCCRSSLPFPLPILGRSSCWVKVN